MNSPNLLNNSNQPIDNKQAGLDALVLGNVALDILCCPVGDVPRHHSMTFEQSVISPGGCGSNTAIGLAALGIRTGLIASIGDDLAGRLAMETWHRFNLDTRFVHKRSNIQTGVSVGLVDDTGSPRFIHTIGANQHLTVNDLNVLEYIRLGIKVFHVAGYFLLPGLLSSSFRVILSELHQLGALVSLDVQQTPRMSNPELLWLLMPDIDLFMCNQMEAEILTGSADPTKAVQRLHNYGTAGVIIKMGADGCLLSRHENQRLLSAPEVPTLDTTGAGDAFAAGLIAALIRGENLEKACLAGNHIGAMVVRQLGAIQAWETYPG
jgi:sugar/nucleoside kinase (ribokinase family)